MVVSGIHKRFGGIHAVAGVTLKLASGKVTGLIGPNGAGKTTLINIITGFLRPDRGTVSLDGHLLTGLSPYRIARSGMTRTFQDLRLIRDISVLDNVMLAFPSQDGERPWAILRWRRVSAQEDSLRRSAMALLKSVDLEATVGLCADELSYGQQKLLTVVCCLASGADWLLLDEPVSGISAALSKRIGHLMRLIVAEGRSVIIIEHDIDFIRHFSDRVLVMNEGVVIADGEPRSVLADRRVVEAYLE